MLLRAQRFRDNHAIFAAVNVALFLTASLPVSAESPLAVCESKTLQAYQQSKPSLNISNETLSVHGQSRVRLTTESQTRAFCAANDKNVLPENADLTLAERDADTARLYEHAREFCIDGDITILGGGSYFGLGLNDSLNVCLQPLPPTSKQLEEFCLNDDSLCKFEHATADSVQSTTFLKFAFLAQVTDVQHAVEQARGKATDSEVTIRIDQASLADIGAVILGINRPTIFGRGAGSGNALLLQNAIQGLKFSFDSLKRVFDLQDSNFERSLNDCNRLVVRSDESENILVDLCLDRGIECIENATSFVEGHVSSCCAYNPIATMKEFNLKNTEGSNCSFNDVCSASRKGIELDLSREAMLSRVDSKVYGRYVKNLEAEHGDFYKETEYLKGHHDGEDSAAATVLQMPGSITCPNVGLGGLNEATLPESLRSNVPANNGYRDLEVVHDFINPTDIGNIENRCNSRYDKGMDDLFARCEAFCGTTGVPIVAGTLSTGLDLKTALGVCFELTNRTAEDEHFCKTKGPASLAKLQESMAEFTSNITIFKSGKLRWTVRMKHRMDEIVGETAFFVEETLARFLDKDKVQELIAFYEGEFANLEDDKSELIELGDRVQVSFQRLRQVYHETFDDVMAYADTCSSSNFPRTKDNQSVLALCHHSQSVCADDPAAKYTYCCCGNNPMLENQELDSDVDICSRSKQLAAQPYINTMAPLLGGTPRESVRRRSGRLAGEEKKLESGEEYFNLFDDGMTTKYGSSYDPPLSKDSLLFALGLCSGTCLETEECQDLICVACQYVNCGRPTSIVGGGTLVGGGHARPGPPPPSPGGDPSEGGLPPPSPGGDPSEGGLPPPPPGGEGGAEHVPTIPSDASVSQALPKALLLLLPSLAWFAYDRRA